MQVDAISTGRIYDITNCDREPIHIPNAIQPHGVLLAVSGPELTIIQVSENAETMLGESYTRVLGQSFLKYLEPESASRFAELAEESDVRRYNPVRMQVGVGKSETCDIILNRHQGHLIIELERAPPPTLGHMLSFSHIVKNAVTRLRSSKNLDELCRSAADEVLKLTGMDRVMVYFFDKDWNGAVIAEAHGKNDHKEPFLGLHFPASDIPRQARELYRLNWLRIIPTMDYVPSRLHPELNPLDQKPLDLSFSVLRNVSPVHIEYSKNMGLKTSMSISLMKQDKLWGLISCVGFTQPNYVPYEVRAACEFLGEVVSSLLDSRLESEDSDAKRKVGLIQTQLLQRLSGTDDFESALTESSGDLMSMLRATGAAIFFRDKLSIYGDAPESAEIRRLIRWLTENYSQEIFSTEALGLHYPHADKLNRPGVLAVPLSRARFDSYLIWFRPEVLQTVNWGGNPNKQVENLDGQMRIHPRKSFEAWKEIVRGKSLNWLPYEIEAAEGLRQSILEVILERAEKIERLNDELERSNLELDSFAYAASHDLKEPVRGIYNYANFLAREESSLTDKGRDRLDTVIRLTKRMEGLLDSLLTYAQVGRSELSLRDTDLNEVLAQVREMLKPRLDEQNVELRIPRSLPLVRCDRVRMTEVFSNLIINAMKYNDKPDQRWVEVGFDDSPALDHQITFFVRDNGIGIAPEHYDSIFRIFKRLHAKEEFGGGSGTGLTITKGIIERHGGAIWVESEPGKGTTFKFTIEKARRS